MQKPDFIAITLQSIQGVKGTPTIALGVELTPPSPWAVPETLLLRPLTWRSSSEAHPWPVQPQARVYMRDLIAITLQSETPGYLSLFSLGAGGGCGRLFPNSDQSKEALKVGQVYRFSCDAGGPWAILGPTTAIARRLEYILAIITRAPEALLLHDLNRCLHVHRPAPAPSAHSASFPGVPSQQVPRLFALPPDTWEYGLVALEVAAPSQRPQPGVLNT